MEIFEQIVKVLADLPTYISGVVGILVALIAFFLMIPGDQPEKALQAVVDFIAKFSKK